MTAPNGELYLKESERVETDWIEQASDEQIQERREKAYLPTI